MKSILLAAVALIASPAAAQPITADALMAHIRVLADDKLEGRLPGTPGADQAVAYIAAQLSAVGLAPGAPDGSWYQAVPLVQRRPVSATAAWKRQGRALPLSADQLLLSGRTGQQAVTGARVVFAGYGIVADGHDDLAGLDVKDAVVLIIPGDPQGVEPVSVAQRSALLSQRGAAAVLQIAGKNTPWAGVRANGMERGSTVLGSAVRPAITGSVSHDAALALLRADGSDADERLAAATGKDFRARDLGITADLAVTTAVREFDSWNVIGRLPGTAPAGEAVVLTSHWDHLGICRPEGAPDRICNGAVDNASGIATIIEIARAVRAAPRQERDVLFVATTAEEMGLLGAEWFAEHTPLPRAGIVAALNVDTIAIAKAGLPVALIGRGTTRIDPVVDAVTREMGRSVDTDLEANVMIRRQDGWALGKYGVPAIMVSGAFSDMSLLQAYLAGPYHKPEDDLSRPIELGGAVEDANLHVALVRALADTNRLPRVTP